MQVRHPAKVKLRVYGINIIFRPVSLDRHSSKEGKSKRLGLRNALDLSLEKGYTYRSATRDDHRQTVDRHLFYRIAGIQRL